MIFLGVDALVGVENDRSPEVLEPMTLRAGLVPLLLTFSLAALPLGAVNAQSASGKAGAKRDYWCCDPMPPQQWRREPMGPMFRSRILRQRTFMQGRIPKFYTRLKNPLPVTAENVAGGRALYEKHCETCHGAKGLGSGQSEKGLTPSPALLAFMIKLPETVDPYLMWTIADGGKPFGTDMPAFKNVLTADQIWQIITYMRSGFRG